MNELYPPTPHSGYIWVEGLGIGNPNTVQLASDRLRLVPRSPGLLRINYLLRPRPWAVFLSGINA